MEHLDITGFAAIWVFFMVATLTGALFEVGRGMFYRKILGGPLAVGGILMVSAMSAGVTIWHWPLWLCGLMTIGGIVMVIGGLFLLKKESQLTVYQQLKYFHRNRQRGPVVSCNGRRYEVDVAPHGRTSPVAYVARLK